MSQLIIELFKHLKPLLLTQVGVRSQASIKYQPTNMVQFRDSPQLPTDTMALVAYALHVYIYLSESILNFIRFSQLLLTKKIN